jgi:hypothetical protein
MSTPSGNDVDTHVQRAALITGAIAMSVVIIMGVGWFAVGRGAIEPVEGPPILPLALSGFGVLALIGAGAVSRMLLQAARSRTSTAERLGAASSAHIVGAALRESAAVVGLVATFISGDTTWVLALGALSLVAIGAAWPRRDVFEALARSDGA